MAKKDNSSTNWFEMAALFFGALIAAVIGAKVIGSASGHGCSACSGSGS